MGKEMEYKKIILSRAFENLVHECSKFRHITKIIGLKS